MKLLNEPKQMPMSKYHPVISNLVVKGVNLERVEFNYLESVINKTGTQ